MQSAMDLVLPYVASKWAVRGMTKVAALSATLARAHPYTRVLLAAIPDPTSAVSAAGATLEIRGEPQRAVR